MADHELVISITRGWSTSEVVCNAEPDAPCRQEPECDCEFYNGPDQDEHGWFHTVEVEDDDGNEHTETHRHHSSDECNICNWLNAEDALDCLDGSVGHFYAPGIPIEPVWAGDYYEWKPVTP